MIQNYSIIELVLQMPDTVALWDWASSHYVNLYSNLFVTMKC